MSEDGIHVGDRVIILQMPGVFRVISREGRLVVIETERGVQLKLRAEGVRRVDGAPVVPKEPL